MSAFVWVALTLAAILYAVEIYMVLSKRESRISRQKMYAAFARIVQAHVGDAIDDPSIALDNTLEKIKDNYKQLRYEFPLAAKDAHLIEYLSQFYRKNLDKKNVLIWRITERHEKSKTIVHDLMDLQKVLNPFELMSEEDTILFRQAYKAILDGGDNVSRSAINEISVKYQDSINAGKKQQYTNRLLTVVALLGVILTVFFGVLSLTAAAR